MKEKSRILKKVDDDRSRPVSFNDSFGGGDNQLRFLFHKVSLNGYFATNSFKVTNNLVTSPLFVSITEANSSF